VTRVAVIVPCHNDGALAQQAIASIQEDEPVEIIVVDDGSTDTDSEQKLADIRRSGVQVLRRENGGLGAARNTGLSATTAPLVYPLDADDLLEAGALGAMADTLDAHPQAQFTWGDYAVFGDYDGHYRSPEKFLPWTLTYVNPYPVSSMFRRETLERLGGWEGWAYEDWDLWLRLAGAAASGIRTDRTVYRRRLHGQSRLLAQARRRHKELYAEIARRNAGVLARRRELRTQERPALWKQAAYPVMFGSRSVVPARVEALLIRVMMARGGGLPS
jgi:glycosyltransferase involved in cell wall biosynthesis